MAQLKSGTTIAGSTVWHAGNDGSGSGLDADLLDGQSSAYYQPASTAITTSNIGNQSVSRLNAGATGTTCDAMFKSISANSSGWKECNGVADAPNAGWWMIQSIRHSNASNYWGTQFAYGWEDNQNRPVYHRNVSGGNWGAWQAMPIVSISGSTLYLTF